MYMTSFGQMQAEAAQHVYRHSRLTATALAEVGLIPNTPTAIQEKFAELLAEGLTERAIPHPRWLGAFGPAPTGLGQTTASAAVSATSEVAVQTAMQTAKNTALRSLRAGGLGAGAFCVLSTGHDFYKLVNNDIDGDEFGYRVAENVASGVGGWGGAAAGAAAFGAMGSVVPFFGTTIGVIIGGIVGGIGGSAALKTLAGGFRRDW